MHNDISSNDILRAVPAVQTTSKRISQDQVEIDYDNENIDYYDDNCVDIDDYGDENNLKPDKYHGLLVKMYP